MKAGRLQVKDIDDDAVLAVIDRERAAHPDYCGAIVWTMAESLGVDPALLTAKLMSMAKRGLVSGCPCGCRGDWVRESERQGRGW